jgi:hypothetical protein
MLPSQLGDRDRDVTALRIDGDPTGPEIAALLGLTLANVQQILSRSLRKLRPTSTRPAFSSSGAERAHDDLFSAETRAPSQTRMGSLSGSAR